MCDITNRFLEEFADRYLAGDRELKGRFPLMFDKHGDGDFSVKQNPNGSIWGSGKSSEYKQKIYDAIANNEEIKLVYGNHDLWLDLTNKQLGRGTRGSGLCEILKQEFAYYKVHRCLKSIQTSEVICEPLPSSPIVQQSSQESDFQTTSIESSRSFLGREVAVADLDRLHREGARSILIRGGSGVGKTTLAFKYLRARFGDNFLEFTVGREAESLTSAEAIVEEWLKRKLDEEPGKDFNISLARLKQCLRKKPFGIVIDNIEPALTGEGFFIETYRSYIDLLDTLSDPMLQGLTIITSREPLREIRVSIEDYLLRGLSLADWQAYFKDTISADETTIQNMHRMYGGNTKAMRILFAAIVKDYDGDASAYWQVIKDNPLSHLQLENLINEQFDRLKKISPTAYNLLCRMGCFRYQDIPTIPKEGLHALLWDTDKLQHSRAIEALSSRSLIEHSKQSKYWLHSSIHTEAIKRLQASDSWQETNHKAAEFWTNSVRLFETPSHLTTALEAYYHYFQIDDFEAAGKVLIQEKPHAERVLLPISLGLSLLRSGLWRILLPATERIVDKVSLYIRGRLYLYLGQVSALVYDNRYIDYLAVSRELNEQLLQQEEELLVRGTLYFRILTAWQEQASVQWGAGLKREAVFAMQEALNLLENSDATTALKARFEHFLCNLVDAGVRVQTRDYIFCVLCWSYKSRYAEFLARTSDRETACEVISSIEKESSEFLQANNDLVQSLERNYNYRYEQLDLGLAYVALGECERAELLLQETYERMKLDNISLIARYCCAMGLAELYRKQQDFRKAFDYHAESIEWAEKFDSAILRAAAYYSRGLTYRVAGSSDWQTDFLTAIDLYESTGAYKKVEEVRQAFE